METEFYRLALIRNFLNKVILEIENNYDIDKAITNNFDEEQRNRICKGGLNEEDLYNLAKEVAEYIYKTNIDDKLLRELSKKIIQLCQS
jgi:hypothetical protein